VAAFGDDAREIAIRDIPCLQVGPFHTNTKARLEMAQSILELSRQKNRQIIVVTDGMPTALLEDGEVHGPPGIDPVRSSRVRLHETATVPQMAKSPRPETGLPLHRLVLATRSSARPPTGSLPPKRGGLVFF
jgi:uncharacterized protein with von Willebrand factor type A (vWA) domain